MVLVSLNKHLLLKLRLSPVIKIQEEKKITPFSLVDISQFDNILEQIIIIQYTLKL